MLKILDLFSGIGGFSLGLERTGHFETAAFCEIDVKAREVLRKHWPHVPIFEDVTRLRCEDVGHVDIICGGFPCQDISLAGRGAGLAGERSGLFYEIIRLAKEFIDLGDPPQYVILENVPALRSRGLEEVLRAFFEIGYDAEWHCIPACAVGAFHRRDRIWIIAYPSGKRLEGLADLEESERACRALLQRSAIAGAYCKSRTSGSWQESESGLRRVAHGIPGKLDRIKQLGNTVVPQIPELIGLAIMDNNTRPGRAA